MTINLIFYSKKEFKFPKKNKIIFLDEVGSKKIKENLLDQIDFTVLHLRYEKVNIPILFLSIFNILKYGKNFYKITFIKFVNASYAFSFIDTSLHYCDLIKEIPECKFILIQNGRRQGKELQPFLERLNKSKFKCDYYFVFNKEYANFMKKHIDTHFVVGGSVLNNSHPKAKFIKKIDRIQYISEFHTLESMPTVDYRKWELLPTEFSLKVINNFCNRKNLKLEIIGRTYEHNKEIKFYEQFKIPFTYLKKTKENYSHLSNIPKKILEEKVKLYKDAQGAVDNKDWARVIEIADELDIKFDDVKKDDTIYLEESVGGLSDKIAELKNTYAWLWANTNQESREKVKDQILMSLGLKNKEK